MNPKEKEWQSYLQNESIKGWYKARKQISIFIIVVLLPFIVPSSGVPSAVEKIKIDLLPKYSGSFEGEKGTLFLKKMMRRQYPQLDVTSFHLHKVMLLARSKNGRGGAQLRVGPEFSQLHKIRGRTEKFQRKARDLYSWVHIDNPFFKSWGPWQLNLFGKVKVEKIIVVVGKRQGQHLNMGINGRGRTFRIK